MSNTSRRAMFKLVGALAATSGLVAVLAACGGTLTQPDSVKAAAADVQLISSMIGAMLPALQVHGVPANVLAVVAAVNSDVAAVVPQLAAAIDATSAQPLVQRVMNGFASLAQALASVPNLPANIQQAVADAGALLPIAAALIGLFIPMSTRASRGKSPDQLRANLRAFVASSKR